MMMEINSRSRRSITVAILGRPNVGKSSLFNKLIGRRKSIVLNKPGVTRDRIVESTVWEMPKETVELRFIDTGGLGHELWSVQIKNQVRTALLDADAFILVVDAKEGLTQDDESVVHSLRKEGVFDAKPYVLVANKIDDPRDEQSMLPFYALGLGEPVPVSAEHSRGIADLQEKFLSLVPFTQKRKDESSEARIIILGKPNAGKSTLLNSLANQERAITSPIAGTTSDAVEEIVKHNGQQYTFIDTAGMRRKSKTRQGVEVLSVVKTKAVLKNTDLAILLLDGTLGPSEQDEKIGGLIEEAGTSIIVVVNKWDLMKKGSKVFNEKEAAEHIRRNMRYLKYAPLVFISALENLRIQQLWKAIDLVLQGRRTSVATSEITRFVQSESEVHNPKNTKFYYCRQASRRPPTFVCNVSNPKNVTLSLQRHLVNATRERWGYVGTPLRFIFRGR